MQTSLRGVQGGVNLEAQISLDVVHAALMIRPMCARLKNPFAFVVIVALVASCSRDPERVTVRNVESLIRDNHLQAAMQTADAYLKQHPDAVDLLRLRVIIALKADQLDFAATALQALPPGDHVMSQALRHRDVTVRTNAARLIAEYSITVEPQLLIRGLGDPVPAVRRYCAHVLGEKQERVAVRPLFHLLQDDNWFVRAEAASALGQIRDPRAAGWLARLLGDSDGFVRYSAAAALQDIAQPENREVLLTFYRQAGGERKLNIALALAKLAEPAALESLTNAVTDENVDVRRRVAEALGDYGPSAATNALDLLLNDRDPEVREQAKRSLFRTRQ